MPAQLWVQGGSHRHPLSWALYGTRATAGIRTLTKGHILMGLFCHLA